MSRLPLLNVTITVLLRPTQVKTRDWESGIMGHTRCFFVTPVSLAGSTPEQLLHLRAGLQLANGTLSQLHQAS